MQRASLSSGFIPSLLATSLPETLRFYESLGFVVSGRDASETWAEVIRDGATLRFYTVPPVDTPIHPTLSGTLYIPTIGINLLAAELAPTVPFVWGPEQTPYGTLEIAVRDPNGYLIAFTEGANPRRSVLTSTLTCPSCGSTSEETMPTDACVRLFECPACAFTLRPASGHCCVFCTFGTVPCPPIQLSSCCKA